MRPLILLVALQLFFHQTTRCQSVVINEVLAANRTGPVDQHGEYDDAVELFNPTNKRVALGGMKFVMQNRSWTIPGELSVPARGHTVIWFDGRPDQGPEHAALKLPKSGGTLLLIAADAATVLDVFHYPELEEDVSFGRYPDGSNEPGFFRKPTIGSRVERGEVLAPPASPPVITHASGVVNMKTDLSAEIRYALGGHDPLGEHGVTYTEPIRVDTGTVVKAVAVRSNSMPSKARLWRYRLEMKAPKFPIASIIIDPKELWADSAGINVAGNATNYSRSGADWQRQGHFGWTADTTHYSKVGMAIAGSGTRSLPKRSFKLFARSRFGSGPEGVQAPGANVPPHEVILRADATANAFLHNLFMEQIALKTGSNVDVGASTVVPLEVNGEYWGQYRLIPPKDPEWIMQTHNVEAIDMLAGPSLRVVEGDRDAFHEPLALLSSLISTDDLQEELQKSIDLRSLLDLAAFDLYTGRADHDINVRCWRPKVDGGKWRWIMYDMDLWAPVGEQSLKRMASTAWYEAPFLRTIVEDEKLRTTFLARFGAMLNTVLNAEQASSMVASLFSIHGASMQRDHERWGEELKMPSAQAQFENVAGFVGSRPGQLLQQVSNHFGINIEQVEVRLNEKNAGQILIDGLPLTKDQATIKGWEGVPFILEAIPAKGMEFAGWKGMENEGPMVLIDPSEHRTLKAVFKPRSSGDGL